MCTLEFCLSVKLMVVGDSQIENTRNKQCLKMYMLDITRNKKNALLFRQKNNHSHSRHVLTWLYKTPGPKNVQTFFFS